MPLSPLEYLRHILDETEYLIAESQDLSKERFLQNATLKRDKCKWGRCKLINLIMKMGISITSISVSVSRGRMIAEEKGIK